MPSVMKPGVKPPLPAASDWRNVFTMKVPGRVRPRARVRARASLRVGATFGVGARVGVRVRVRVRVRG